MEVSPEVYKDINSISQPIAANNEAEDIEITLKKQIDQDLILAIASGDKYLERGLSFYETGN